MIAACPRSTCGEPHAKAPHPEGGSELIVERAALGLAPGVYNLIVNSHGSVSGTFNRIALVRVTLQ